MPESSIKRGRWRAARRARASRLAYREPAPDREDRPPPTVAESGHYQALREHWLWSWLRRVVGRRRDDARDE